MDVAPLTPTDGYVIRSDDDTVDPVEGVFENDSTVLTNGTFVTTFEEFDGTDRGIEFRFSDATTGANGLNGDVAGLNGVSDSNPRIAALTGGGFKSSAWTVR